MRNLFARRDPAPPEPAAQPLSPFAEFVGRAATSEGIEELESRAAFNDASEYELKLASVRLEELRARVHNELWARESRAQARHLR